MSRFSIGDLGKIVESVNSSGYGLTFGMHSRIDERVDGVSGSLNVGNIYINRNQIGAVVGSQPFGGEGLSGTGPKAGGPEFLRAFLREDPVSNDLADGPAAEADAVQALLFKAAPSRRKQLARREMPGPTGEANRLSFTIRGARFSALGLRQRMPRSRRHKRGQRAAQRSVLPRMLPESLRSRGSCPALRWRLFRGLMLSLSGARRTIFATHALPSHPGPARSYPSSRPETWRNSACWRDMSASIPRPLEATRRSTPKSPPNCSRNGDFFYPYARQVSQPDL